MKQDLKVPEQWEIFVITGFRLQSPAGGAPCWSQQMRYVVPVNNTKIGYEPILISVFGSTPLWELVWHLDHLTNRLDHQKSDAVVMGGCIVKIFPVSI